MRILKSKKYIRVKRNTRNFVWKKEDHLLNLNNIQLTDSEKYREGKLKRTPNKGVK